MPRLDHRSEEISDHCIMAKFDIFGAQTLKKKKNLVTYINIKKFDLLNLNYQNKIYIMLHTY